MRANPSVQQRVMLGAIAALALTAAWLLRIASAERSLSAASTPSLPLPRAVPVAPSPALDRSTTRTSNATTDADATSVAAFAPPLGNDDALRAWARRDPAQAIRWLATEPAGLKRDVVLEIVCLEVVQFDPAQALSIADRYGYPGMNLRENLVGQWAEQDARAATAYAGALSPGPERDQAFQRVAFSWSKTNPAEAAQLVLDEIPPGPAQVDAIASVVQQWAQTDAAQARQWIETSLDERTRDRAIKEWQLAQAAQ